MRFKILFSTFIILSSYLELHAQEDSLAYNDIYTVINLDSFVITATRAGFSVEDFVEMVRKDKRFYQAFRNLRLLSYTSDNEVLVFNKKRKKKASYNSKTKQLTTNKCRKMDILSENIKGKYYKKNKSPKYYTSKLYERLFFTKGTVCEGGEQAKNQAKKASRMESYVSSLKTLIFQPGEEVDIPIIGKKMAIFDKKMQPYYDYSISSKSYKNGMDCYVFKAVVKPEYQERQQSKTVVKYLETYFAKADFQIVARNYHLAYNGALFDFDVKMEIELDRVGGQYLPVMLTYDGLWDVPAKRPEMVQFSTRFYDFDTP